MGILPQLLQLVKPLTILIGPAPIFFLYRSWQSTPNLINRQRRPLQTPSLVAIAILLSSALVYIIALLFGGSENIFYLARTRFVTSPAVLHNRLAKVRAVTQFDTILLQRLGTSLAERINYATYGPQPLTHCTWCLTPHTDPIGTTLIGDASMYLLFS